MEMEPINTEVKRNEDGTFAEGTSPGPGRTPGKTMKEYAKEYLQKKTDEEKNTWLDEMNQETVWKMAEGNPAQGMEHSGTVRVGKPIDEVEDVQKDQSLQEDKSLNQEG